MLNDVVISGTGLWVPEQSISNQELVESYNAWVSRFNRQHQAEIDAGTISAKALSSAEFIEKASGIKSRYAYEKQGILDIDRMRPSIEKREESALSHQAEIASFAAQKALNNANLKAEQIDAVIVSCAYTQRAYPAIAIEVQHALGIQGFGFDMLVACSAATFALQRAYDMVRAGSAKKVLVINPELITPQLNFTDRDSHFIFGDVATAVVIENQTEALSETQFKIVSTSAKTHYSNNIRSNFGYMSRATDEGAYSETMMFHQKGRQVFKEVCPMVVTHLQQHIEQANLTADDVKRWWLHQANINMNQLIAKKLLGGEISPEKAPVVLDRFGNTASAGSIIAFHLHQDDFTPGDHGVLCSFGAGYSIGSLIVTKL